MESTNAVAVAAPELSLFSVVLPWNTDDSEEGTYGTSVWAKSYDDAERAVAEEMADHSDSGCETDEEREKWVENLLDNVGGQSVIMKVSDTVVKDVRELFAGPSGDLSGQAKLDFEAALKLLGKHVAL